MEKGNNNSNNNGNTNNNSVDNTQRDNNNSNNNNNNNTREFYMPQSEPPGTSLPGSSTSTPLDTSPFHEPLAAPVTTTSPTPSTNLTNVSPSPSTNNLTTTTTTTTTATTATTTTTPTPAAAHKTQAAFVNKLYTMVEDQSIQNLISWAPSGDVFSVSNPTEFSKSVLPQYFKHNNWQSFVRQLNMYGFHKVNDMFHANPTSESQAWEFKHSDFRRGHLAALQNIKRKSSKPPNPIIKGNLGNSGTGQNPSADTDTRDDRIDCLTTQMSEMMDRMRQMSESYSLLYAETVSCKMLQSKHQQVITAITSLLATMSREDDSNDPRSLKRKFDIDLLTAEVAKLGQGDIPPPSHSPMMQHPSSHYPREHPTRSMSTPQPMVGLEPTSNMHTNSMNDIEYRMQTSSPFGSNHHRPQSKVHQTSSPLAMLPEIPFSSFQPSNNYLRHRSPEPISGVSPANSRSASLDTYSSRSVSGSQTASQYSQSNSHSSHMSSSSLPSPPTRRTSQPASSLGFENPVVNNPSTSQTRAPPLSDPPDNNEEFVKRRKRN
ncbi:winged helix DNA-binding domain-containing protein [Rhizophagus clarus]|uniref:Winged helix DNA-binding domain-containing protein n=1 Tax=Rhizophagus clarus TaxID=94130 RepID=A0A8H3QV71_9GLOM|nr:winged helix DNA-binding domain-containing protein [Rhizophagus clarus]